MDLVLGFGHQGLAHRVRVLFEQREEFHFFPRGDFADEALEVGPHRNMAGPGLLLLSNVRPPPPEAAAWVASEPGLARHLQRTLWLDRGKAGEEDLRALAAAAAAAVAAAGVGGLRVVAAPTRLAGEVTDLLPEWVPLEPRAPSHLLCVARLPAGDVTAGQHGEWNGQSCPWAGQPTEGRAGRRRVAAAVAAAAAAAAAAEGRAPAEAGGAAAPADGPEAAAAEAAEAPEPRAVLPLLEVRYEYRWGLVPAEWGFAMRGEAPPERPFADAPASAVHKLDEALRMLGLHERAHHAAAAGAPQPWAIDLGAAPGAWTQHLVRCLGYAVAAVDPAELAPSVLELPAVRHVRALSEAAGPALEALLPAGGAELLVSDMCAHPVQAVKVLRPLLRLLRPGGLLVMTLKLPGVGRDRTGVVARVRRDLGPEVVESSVKAVWLLSNTACERTLIARRAHV
ncbi:hypothetical protein Rsub_01672 [Raphidocelis subcapitata]|uniref:Ribosomal RNA methyltransferase FtsJ domain-containing protein n=1 Tax=Raphidocelis subcapitata TaxID=307507 RepID=A0A2V0NMM7_9CHLO|nr:hypothetical protein Rsub_01672 [Raphidocelis subcapitata]|eukprot:GBF88771.1 hypothetical protein Rsub_01672 [Raphidocelis subcapitata]